MSGRLFGRNGETVNGHTWELLGIYTTESAADARCTRELDFVWPVLMDSALPEETAAMEGCRYPRLGQSPAEPGGDYGCDEGCA